MSLNKRATLWVRSIACAISIVLLFSFATPALAAPGVPRILNNQGRLMDSSGTLLGGAGTDYCFKFSLYDDATVGSGTKLWPSGTPSTMTVAVRNGIYNVGIGDTNAGGDTLDFNFQDTDAAYLNVEVAAKVGATCAPGDGAESFENLAPRQRIAASGYAINAGLLGGYAPAQNASGDQIPVLSMGRLVLGDANASINATSTNALTLQGGGDATGDIQFFGAGNRITSLGDMFLSGLASAASIFGMDEIAVGTTATTSLQGSATGTSTIQGFLNVTGANSTSTFSGNLAVNRLAITGAGTSTSAGGFDISDGCYAVDGECLEAGVSSVTAGDGTLSIAPTGGAIVAALNLANPNLWTGLQQFTNASSTLFESVTQFAHTIQSTSTNPLILKTNLAATAGLTLGGTTTPQMLAADTLNDRITIGTGGASPVLFVLDTKNTPGDPLSPVDGAEYYNSNTGEFRCYSGSAWRTCGGIASSTAGALQFKAADGSFAGSPALVWDDVAGRLQVFGEVRAATLTATSSVNIEGSSATSSCYAINGTCYVGGNAYARRIVYLNDFMAETGTAGTTGISGSDGLFEVNSGTNAATANQAIANASHPGVARSTTGSTATGRAALVPTSLSSIALGAATTTYEVVVNPTTLSTSAQRYQLVLGFFDTQGANQTDGVYFLYDEGGVSTGSTASPNWQCATVSNSTRTFTNSGTAVSAGSWVRLTIVVNAAGSQADFYINGTPVCANTTNIPTGTARAFGYGTIAQKSVGGTARTFDFDYVLFEQVFTSPR